MEELLFKNYIVTTDIKVMTELEEGYGRDYTMLLTSHPKSNRDFKQPFLQLILKPDPDYETLIEKMLLDDEEKPLPEKKLSKAIRAIKRYLKVTKWDYVSSGADIENSGEHVEDQPDEYLDSRSPKFTHRDEFDAFIEILDSFIKNLEKNKRRKYTKNEFKFTPKKIRSKEGKKFEETIYSVVHNEDKDLLNSLFSGKEIDKSIRIKYYKSTIFIALFYVTFSEDVPGFKAALARFICKNFQLEKEDPGEYQSKTFPYVSQRITKVSQKRPNHLESYLKTRQQDRRYPDFRKDLLEIYTLRKSILIRE